MISLTSLNILKPRHTFESVAKYLEFGLKSGKVTLVRTGIIFDLACALVPPGRLEEELAREQSESAARLAETLPVLLRQVAVDVLTLKLWPLRALECALENLGELWPLRIIDQHLDRPKQYQPSIHFQDLTERLTEELRVALAGGPSLSDLTRQLLLARKRAKELEREIELEIERRLCASLEKTLEAAQDQRLAINEIAEQLPDLTFTRFDLVYSTPWLDVTRSLFTEIAKSDTNMDVLNAVFVRARERVKTRADVVERMLALERAREVVRLTGMTVSR